MDGKALRDLINRLNGRYEIPITDGLGPAGGEEPDNAETFVRTFPTTPINQEAARALTLIDAQHAQLFAALTKLLDRYVELVNCGDCGNWDPEEEPEVIAARAAIAVCTQPQE